MCRYRCHAGEGNLPSADLHINEICVQLALVAQDPADLPRRLAAEGLPNAEMARRLYLAEGTVRNYLSSAIAKLGARNRTEAANRAHERGWL